MVKAMSSRMDKYNKEDAQKNKRTFRNKSIYNKTLEDYDKIDLSDNVSIIETPTEDLNIDEIKKILDDKYQKKKRAPEEVEDIEEIEINEPQDVEDTKEYDLKKVLETAHKNKKSDYDHERFAKLKKTQYDILKSLNIEKNNDDIIEESLTVEEANLMNLIKTINYNAEKNKIQKDTTSEEDLLSELKGTEETEVLEPIPIDYPDEPDKKPTIIEELEKTKQLSKKEIANELKKMEDDTTDQQTDKLNEKKYEDYDDDNSDDEDDKDEEEIDEEESSKIEKDASKLEETFYTGKLHINDSDMDDDFEDWANELNSGNIFIKILILLLVIIILAVIVYFLNKYLQLGLF